jgi:hypothetical protein
MKSKAIESPAVYRFTRFIPQEPGFTVLFVIIVLWNKFTHCLPTAYVAGESSIYTQKNRDYYSIAKTYTEMSPATAGLSHLGMHAINTKMRAVVFWSGERLSTIQESIDSRIYLFERGDRESYHSCKIHSNHPALALVLFRSWYTCKSIDRHPGAWFLLSENHNADR